MNPLPPFFPLPPSPCPLHFCASLSLSILCPCICLCTHFLPSYFACLVPCSMHMARLSSSYKKHCIFETSYPLPIPRQHLLPCSSMAAFYTCTAHPPYPSPPPHSWQPHPPLGSSHPLKHLLLTSTLHAHHACLHALHLPPSVT